MEKKQILIVDDDVSFLQTFSLILKDNGFSVTESTTAESCFEALVTSKPDLVLLDKNLPDKSGYEVLKSIKNSKNFSNIPVVIITADTTATIDEAFDNGADDCLFKPMNIDETIKRIRSLIK